MPIYEYEPCDHDCLICSGRVEALQGINDAPHEFCPTCGLPVKRVVSSVSFEMKKAMSPDKAASRGFTTYRKAGKGTYEKIGGDGPGAFTSPNSGQSEPPRKVIDLDKQS